MNHTKGITCQVTAYQVADLPEHEILPSHTWFAIASAHVYNPHPNTGGVLSNEDAVRVGAVLQTVRMTASADTETKAMTAALASLLDQMDARGLR